MFLAAQTSWSFTSGIRTFIGKSSLLTRLFITNRFADKILVIFQDLFSGFKIFGCYVGDYSYKYDNGVAQVVSNIWLFDNLMSSGLFGAIFFMAALVIGLRRMFKYINSSDDLDSNKYLISGYVLGFFIISLILFDNYPLVNIDKMSPFFTTSPLLICLFLLGYTFNKSMDKPVTQVEEKKEEELDEIIAA